MSEVLLKEIDTMRNAAVARCRERIDAAAERAKNQEKDGPPGHTGRVSESGRREITALRQS